MIHREPEVILPQTFNLLQLLQEDESLMDFFLVGGTALALHIGELEKPMLKNKITFDKVRKRLVQATERPERIFPGQ